MLSFSALLRLPLPLREEHPPARHRGTARRRRLRRHLRALDDEPGLSRERRTRRVGRPLARRRTPRPCRQRLGARPPARALPGAFTRRSFAPATNGAIRLVTGARDPRRARDNDSGVDGRQSLTTSPHDDPMRSSASAFESSSAYEAFGVPTFVVNEDATFVRYMNPPTVDPAASIEPHRSRLSHSMSDESAAQRVQAHPRALLGLKGAGQQRREREHPSTSSGAYWARRSA